MSLGNLPSVSEMLKEAEISAKKKFGQNFLFDMNITDKIVKSIPNLKNLNVVEIGPGPAGLTRSLLNLGAKSVLAVEMDRDMITILDKIKIVYRDRFDYICGNALDLDKEFYVNIPTPRAICSNLPYNVGTELLIRWLHHISDFESLTLMFQKEVAERILAKPNDEQYGRLSILVSAVADVEKLFDLSPNCFVPAPKVWSSVVLIRPKAKPIVGEKLERLEKLSAKLFSNRRKMIRAILKDIPNLSDILDKCGILETLRPENLSFEQLVRLSEFI